MISSFIQSLRKDRKKTLKEEVEEIKERYKRDIEEYNKKKKIEEEKKKKANSKTKLNNKTLKYITLKKYLKDEENRKKQVLKKTERGYFATHTFCRKFQMNRRLCNVISLNFQEDCLTNKIEPKGKKVTCNQLTKRVDTPHLSQRNSNRSPRKNIVEKNLENEIPLKFKKQRIINHKRKRKKKKLVDCPRKRKNKINRRVSLNFPYPHSVGDPFLRNSLLTMKTIKDFNHQKIIISEKERVLKSEAECFSRRKSVPLHVRKVNKIKKCSKRIKPKKNRLTILKYENNLFRKVQ